MRRKAVVVVAGACLLSLLTPAQSEAIIGRGWLERLSGPGPFTGETYGQRFLCVSRPAKTDDVEVARKSFDSSFGRYLTLSDPEGRFHAGLVGCNFLPRDKPLLEIALQLSRLKSTENLLDYSSLPEQADREVRVRLFMVTADVRVNRALDVGTAFGIARFSPDTDVAFFDGFSRGVWQPLRLSMRPLAAVIPERKWEAFTIRLELNHVPAGFTDRDFGARAGTFNEPGELLWNWWVGVDVGTFFWK